MSGVIALSAQDEVRSRRRHMDNPGPSEPKTHLVQAPPLCAGHQEGPRRTSHPAIHPTGQMANYRKENAGVCRSLSYGRVTGHQPLWLPSTEGQAHEFPRGAR